MPGTMTPGDAPGGTPVAERAMTRDAGWAALLSPEEGEVVGRGHVLVRRRPPAAPGGAPLLRGELGSLRLRERGAAVPAGIYELRFEHSAEHREVWLDEVEPSAERSTAGIRFVDPDLPVTAAEVSDGE